LNLLGNLLVTQRLASSFWADYLSARKAAKELNRRGITTAEGGKWFAAQVIGCVPG
jgi:hypothetical protein